MEHNRVRYILDFKTVPRIVKDEGPDFLYRLLEKGESYICDIFNSYYDRVGNRFVFKDHPRHFSEDQFAITYQDLDDELKIIYVSLPDDYTSIVYCTAYVFVYFMENEKIVSFTMFTIEKSVGNTTCIAHMWDGDRTNLGEATGSINGDIQLIKGMVYIE